MSELESQPLILANSFECGWQGLNLILEREVRGEIPGADLDFHFITIALDNVRASHKTAHGWHHSFWQICISYSRSRISREKEYWGNRIRGCFRTIDACWISILAASVK
jgi:hypothetical protein